MEWTLLLLAVALVSLLVLKVALSVSAPVVVTDDEAGATERAGVHYRLKPMLLSPAEQAFLAVLDQAVGEEYRVFGKVRVADLLDVKPMLKRSAWANTFSRIMARHVDFLICRRDDLRLVCAIELDDRSHRNPERQARDQLLDEICQVAGLKLWRVPLQNNYSAAEIRRQIRLAEERSDATTVEPCY